MVGMARDAARRSTRARVVGALAVAVAAELTCGAVVAAGGHDSRAPAAASRHVVAHARPPVGAATGAPQPAAAGRGIAAQAVLDRMAAAVLARDAAGYVAAVDPDQAALRAAAARTFRNLAGVPLASWSYSVDPVPAADLPPDRQQALGRSAWLAAVTFHYALLGYDAQPAAQRLYVTFAQRAGQWYVAGYGDGGPTRPSAADIWDFGPVLALAGARSLVLGHPAERAELASIAAEADRDVPRVAAFWGRAGWRQRVVIVVPSSAAELSRLVDGQDLSQFAAVATVEIDGAESARAAAGDRILVNPANFDDLGALGRRVVLTHEITHVATRPVTGPLLPDWLIEGIADYVGFRDAGLPPRSVAPELAADVDAGHVPTALPSDTAFDGAAPHLAESYEEAWLACRWIADRYGEPALIALYRAVGTSSAATRRDALRAGLDATLHLTIRGLVAAWRADVRAELS
jgi:hypothetical protein